MLASSESTVKVPPHSRGSFHRTFNVIALMALGALPTIVCGCGDPPIVVHDSVPITRGSSIPDAVAADSTPRFRMVTAIAFHADSTWFFKMSGPIENVGGMQAKWGEFLGGVRFEGDQPAWDLPEGWKSEGIQEVSLGGGMKMLKGNVETADEDVAISVSRLGGRQGLLGNVNRWRGQLGLGDIDSTQLAKDLSEIKTDKIDFKVFDAQGPTLSGRMGGAGRPPFASGAATMPSNHPPVAGSEGGSLPTTTASPKNKEISFTAPSDWQAGKTSTMVVGRFSKETELGHLELIVMTMRASDEAWKMNVEAWGNQLKLVDKPDVTALTEVMKVADKPAKQVRLNGDNPVAKDNQAVVAVLIQHKPEDGFVVKFSGTQAAVDANHSTLDEFLKSISFAKQN